MAITVSLKFDLRFNSVWNRSSRTGEETVVIGRIQHPNHSGFIERDELIFSRELTPHLEVDEGIRFPLIGTGVLAKSLLIDRAHGGGLRCWKAGLASQ